MRRTDTASSRFFGSSRRALLAVAVVLALAAGCHHGPRVKTKVVTSIFPIYDLARRVAGPDADVVMLEPVEVSPHQFTSTPAAMQAATGANLAVMVGLDLDAWMQPVLTRVAEKAHVLKLADRVPTLPRAPSLEDEGNQAMRAAARRGIPQDDPRTADPIDAHAWLDPQRALLMARAIGEELCRVDPGHAQGYRARSLAVTQSIDALDREVEARSARWKQRSFVSLHDAFRYYAARYHLDVVATVEPYPGIRPSIRYDQLVLRRLHERGAGGVFGEPQLDATPAHTLAQAANIPYGTLDPLGGTSGVDSYEGLIRYDTDALEKVLAAPAVAPDSGPYP